MIEVDAGERVAVRSLVGLDLWDPLGGLEDVDPEVNLLLLGRCQRHSVLERCGRCRPSDGSAHHRRSALHLVNGAEAGVEPGGTAEGDILGVRLCGCSWVGSDELTGVALSLAAYDASAEGGPDWRPQTTWRSHSQSHARPYR